MIAELLLTTPLGIKDIEAIGRLASELGERETQMNPAQKFLADRTALADLISGVGYQEPVDMAEIILAAGWTAPDADE